MTSLLPKSPPITAPASDLDIFARLPCTAFVTRLSKIRQRMLQIKVDAAFITHPPDIRWACGFTGSNGLLLVLPHCAHFLTDSRYREQARQEVHDAEVHVPGYYLDGYVYEKGLLNGLSNVLYQAEVLPAARLAALQQQGFGCNWIGGPPFLAPLVASKEEAEIAVIREAQRLTDHVFDQVLGLLKPGMTERIVAAEIVYRLLIGGAEKVSFDPIVASGPNSALPHARPSLRRLQQDEPVLLDFGCVVDGYASDMTRTVFLGRPDQAFQEVYHTVLEAQLAALDYACAGIASDALDAAARTVISEKGYGDAFTHSLGHGVGLQVHEWPPVSFRSDVRLPANTVVAIEPGIYLPGKYGVRIEDLVVLREGTCENLTASPKQLIRLD